MARKYISVDDFLHWLRQKTGNDGIASLIEAKIEFGKPSVRRFVDILADRGILEKVFGGKRGNRVDSVRIIGKSQSKVALKAVKVIRRPRQSVAQAQLPASRDTQIQPSAKQWGAAKLIKERSVKEPIKFPGINKEKSIVLIDYDNVVISSRQTRDVNLKPEDIVEVYECIQKYAFKFGEIALEQVFITTKTESGLDVLKYFKSLDVPVNIVSPRPNAADNEIERFVDFVLNNCSNIKNIVLVGNDGEAFGPLCEKIRNKGRRAYVVTPGVASHKIARSASGTVSLFTLMKREKANKGHCSGEIFNRFLEKKTTDKEVEFIKICFDFIKKIHSLSERRYGLEKLAQKIWNEIDEGWKQEFGFEDCEKALRALVAQDCLKRSFILIDKKNIPVWEIA